MAVGRDAADVALTTIFGPHRLAKFVVWTDEVKEARCSRPTSADHNVTRAFSCLVNVPRRNGQAKPGGVTPAGRCEIKAQATKT